jgi:hypothetical protein
MSHGFHPTGLFLTSHSIFGVFEPPDHAAYLDAIGPHFQPSLSPRVQVYVVSLDKVSPWPLTPYLEASVFISVRHGVMEGWYPLMMPVTGRVAMIGGRLHGFPKEMTDITLTDSPDGWVGTARKGERTLLHLEVTGLAPITEEFRDVRTQNFGAPMLNLVPPLRGPKVVATTIETLEPETATRLQGELTISTDPTLPWAPLLRQTAPGYFETTHGARVLRYGRVAAKYPSTRGVQVALG